MSRSVTYFEHLATADFETPVKREICLTDRPASSKRDMISFRCCNASCWNDETLRQPERRRMGQRTVPCPSQEPSPVPVTSCPLSHCHELEARAEALDPDELETARLSLRPEEEKQAVSKVEDAYGESYDYATMREAKDRVSDLMGDEPIGSKPRSVRRDLQQAQEKVREHVQERRERLSGKEKENTWEQ